jgi:CubicO group peptidase (beta-lactamase class C family)
MLKARLIACALLLVASGSALAAPAVTPTTDRAGGIALETSDLDAFFDPLVNQEMRAGGVMGAAVVLMEGPTVRFARGYGFSDADRKKGIDPASTLFRAGSISKLITAIAVLQLVEQGKLAIDRPIASYLDFRLPTRYAEPVTLRHLLTHTAGFEEVGKGIFVADPARLLTLSRYVRERAPVQIHRPGQRAAYSNYGVALAGYIVERAAQMSFDRYVRERILSPLKMRNASFSQPLETTLRSAMSKGYADGEVRPFELVNPSPAGALSASPLDLGYLAAALLERDPALLAPAIWTMMLSRQAAGATRADAQGLAAYQSTFANVTAWGHGGDTGFFHSTLLIFPKHNLALIVVQNTRGGSRLLTDVVSQTFIQRFLAQAAPPAWIGSHAPVPEGLYWSARRAETTLLRFGGLIQQSKLRATPEGQVVVDSLTDLSGSPLVWKRIGPDTFASNDGRRMGISAAPGRPTTVTPYPFMTFEEVPFADRRDVNAGLAVFATGTMLLALIGLAFRRTKATITADRLMRGLTLATRAACVLYLLVIVTFVATIFQVPGNIFLLDGSLDPVFITIRLLGIAALGGTICAVVLAVRHWQDWARVTERLGATTIALACVACGWLVVHWRIVGLSLDY